MTLQIQHKGAVFICLGVSLWMLSTYTLQFEQQHTENLYITENVSTNTVGKLA